MTHICVSKLTIIGSDNGLAPDRRQAIIWTNAGLLLIGPLGTNFIEISIEITAFSFKKTRLKVSSAKRRLFCLVLNVLRGVFPMSINQTVHILYIYIGHQSESYWNIIAVNRSSQLTSAIITRSVAHHEGFPYSNYLSYITHSVLRESETISLWITVFQISHCGVFFNYLNVYDANRIEIRYD